MRLKKKGQVTGEGEQQTPSKSQSSALSFEETKIEMPSPNKVESSKAVIEEIRDLKQQQLNAVAIGEGTKESVLASETRESEETRSEPLRTEGESIQSDALAGGDSRAEEGSGT